MLPPRRIVHVASGRVLADQIEMPRTFFGRGVGLMLRSRLEPGHAMLIDPCNGIHMLGMRFAIDALFLDRHNRVKKVFIDVRPWIGVVWIVLGARKVLELPGGTLASIGLQPGDQVELQLD